jgi:alpha-galactosidase
LNRRDFLRIATGAAITSSVSFSTERGNANFSESVRGSRSKIVPADSSAADISKVRLSRQWKGDFCQSKLVNDGKQAARIREVVLFDIAHNLPADTPFYGESFQMLSQTSGTLAAPIDLGYSETKHYKIPQPDNVTAVSGLLCLSPAGKDCSLLAFTSCQRFAGRFYIGKGSIQAVVDTEGLELGPGESWTLEEFMASRGPRRSDLENRLATRIGSNHPQRIFQPIPTGWCSWYCFGPRVTAHQILDNLNVIAKDISGLKYVQIDDGYQAAMGDWLETGKAFGGDIVPVLKEIRQRGFEPAIWVAPFIAERDSHVFQQHPDWFIKDADGKPLASNEVTFGGWRHGPWYALDGTHPDVRAHFEQVFRTMRQDWGCTYFKLDANFWGAMHGGRFHDPKATRVQAYRRGMEAIRRGAGNSFILGCNHPIWPSFGLIDGSRSSGDIKRTWPTFAKEARQTLYRNWQNGRVWWNDPDAVLLTGDLSDDEYQFHATAIYASGGMVLSGDDLTRIAPNRRAMLQKLLPPTGVAADFDDDSLRVGFIKPPAALMVCVFNWEDKPQSVSIRLPKPGKIKDFWTEADLGKHQGVFAIKDMAPHSARLLVCS